jgi:hypothetical protein
MTTACQEKYQRLVDEVLLGPVPPAKWERLRTHLKGCEDCRARYNRVVLAERMLHGGPGAIDTPSPDEIDRIAGGIFAEETPAWKRMLQWFAPTPRWATGVAMTAAALLLIPLLSQSPSPPGVVPHLPTGSGPIEQFQARGVSTMSRQAGLRAFCLVGDRVVPLEGKEARCERQSSLKLAVSNPGNYARVFLVGVDGDGAIKWYSPRPPEKESVQAPAGIAEQPLGSAVRLEVNHGRGPVRVFALFSDKPIKSDEVAAAVGELAKTGDALPLKRDDVLQRSITFAVE